MLEQNERFEVSHLQFSNNLAFVGNGHKPPNLHKWGPGERDIYALHYIVSGKGVLETRHDIFSLSEGESFIIYPHKEVYYYPDRQDPWEYVWVEFNGDEARRLLSFTSLSPDKPVVTISHVNLKPFFDIAKNANIKPFDKTRSEAKIRLLLSYYMEFYQKEIFNRTDYVGLAKDYIHNNYWKTAIRTSDIVKVAKIERSYLFRLFKAATGMSVSTYLTAYRIRRACELLKTLDISIKSVACSVGYRDQLYFSKIFKKATSYTPSEYMTLHACCTEH